MNTLSVAHKGTMNHFGEAAYPDGLVPWNPEQPPQWPPADPDSPEALRRTTGRLRSCWYCSSMHPTDLVAALKAGARLEWADRKYGWPHKAYIDGIPNPHAGMIESRAGHSNPPAAEIANGAWLRVHSQFDSTTGERLYTWYERGRPAAPVTRGKFYTVHLQDATPEERAVIEKAMGLAFTFTADGRVSWQPVAP